MSRTEIIAAARVKADTKYGPMKSSYEGLGALELEFHEVKDAMQKREPVWLRLELCDMINVCNRWLDFLGAEG